ncbi:hypothetical protein ACWWJF_11325 [Symbiopectobacterium sp. Eva_TO]
MAKLNITTEKIRKLRRNALGADSEAGMKGFTRLTAWQHQRNSANQTDLKRSLTSINKRQHAFIVNVRHIIT